MQKSIIFTLLILLYSSTNVISQDIKIKNGVKYIHNKKPQWGKEPKVKLEFIQEIGGIYVEDKNYMMSDIRDVFRDREGNLYIPGFRSHKIKKFDINGTFLKNIGRQGQGPGELNGPMYLNVDNNNQMYIYNFYSNMISVFDSKENELNRFHLRNFPIFRLLSSNKIIADNLRVNGRMVTDKLPLFFVYDLDGNLLYTFGKLTYIQRANAGSFYYVSGLKFETDNTDKIFCTYEYQNKIEKRDDKGNIIFIAERQLNYKTEKEHREHIARGKISYSNIVSRGIGIDYKERIWVTTYKKQPKPISLENRDEIFFRRHGTRKEHAQFEIFDKESILLGYLPQPCDIFYWRMFGDRLYIIDENRVSVKEYKIVDLEQ